MRRTVFVIYALVFVDEVLQASILPLLPTFGAELGLSKVEIGALLSSTTFAAMVAAFPAGLLADRMGARAVAAGAGALIAAGALVQGFAPDFWTLLAGRLVFGLAYGAVWTAGPATVTDSTSTRRAAALGGTVTVGGAAYLAGPPFAGFTAEHIGLAAPFVAVAACALGVTALLALAPSGRPARRERRPLRPALRAAGGERLVRSAAGLIALSGLAVGVVHLLVPLQLDENGLSPGEIGAVFSAGSAVYILGSGIVARLGERAARLPVAGVGALLLGGAFLLPFSTVATPAVIIFLLLRSAFGSPLSTITYPLSDAGARTVGVGGGTVIGLMNLIWAAAAVIAPLGGGALAQAVGERWTFGAVVAACSTVGASILLAHRRTVRAEAAVEYS